MKNKFAKKLLAFLLSVSMLFSVVSSLPVFAENEVYGIMTDSDTIYNCDRDGKNQGSTKILKNDVTHLFVAGNLDGGKDKEAMWNFTNLVNLTILPTVYSIAGTFGGSTRLENIDFSNATGLAEITSAAFMKCSSLKTVDLSKATDLRRLDMGIRINSNVFDSCDNLETVILPKSLEWIGQTTFQFCYKLADVTFGSKTPPFNNMQLAFRRTKSGIRFHLPAGSKVKEWENTIWVKSASNPVFIIDHKYGIYKNDGNVYECDENAVATETIVDKKVLSYLFIANDVTEIKDQAFSEYSNIIEVDFSNAANLTSIGDNAFSGCENIETMAIPDTVTSIGAFAFANCKNLTTANLPNNITKIENSTFINCSKLERIAIPQNVTEIDSFAFFNCPILSSVSFPRILPPTLGMSSFESTKDGIKIFLNDTASQSDWQKKLLAAGMKNPTFEKDITPPTATIKVGDANFNSATTPVTFDTLLHNKSKISITANDIGSGISKIEYQEVSNEADYNIEGLWKIYERKINASHLGKNIFYIRVTDFSGNQTIINTNGFTVYADSTLQTEVTEFDRKEENRRDMFVRVNLNGNTLKEIKNGGTILQSGTDYIIEDSPLERNSDDFPESSSLILFIQKSYLAKLPSGTQTLTFNFNPYGVQGNLVINTPLEITITDTGHIHEFNTEFTTEKAATCTKKGEKSRHCKDFALCGGKTDISEIGLIPHTVGTTWQHDPNSHWRRCTVCDRTVENLAHNWETMASKLSQEANQVKIDAKYPIVKLISNNNPLLQAVERYCTVCGEKGTEDIQIATVAKDMTTGKDLVYTQGTKTDGVFTSTAELKDFVGVQIIAMGTNDTLLPSGTPLKGFSLFDTYLKNAALGHYLKFAENIDSDKDNEFKIPIESYLSADSFTLKPGSTIVTVKHEYLDTLPAGKHMIAIVSTTGIATTTFTVLDDPTKISQKTSQKIPQTNDNNTPLYTILFFVSSGMLTILSLSRKKGTKYHR